MKIINTEDYNIKFHPIYDQYYNFYKLENKETGEIFNIQSGIQSSFCYWFQKQEKHYFFRLLKKQNDYYKIRPVYGNEKIKIKKLYPEYFI